MVGFNDVWRRLRLLVLVGAVVAMTLFILACGDDATKAPPAATTAPAATVAPAAPAATSTPVPKSKELVEPRLRVSMPAPAGQVTCHCETFQSAGGHLHNLHEYLVGLDPVTGEEKPIHLGLNWSVDASGKNWNFKLREGVPYYKDGRTSAYSFKAEDVVHTWAVMAGFKGVSEPGGDWTPMMDTPEEGWTIVNDYEIILHHKLIELELPFRLSEEWTFGLQSLDYWNDIGGMDAYKADPMGTGSFSFVEKVVNQHILYKANKDHWRKAPEFDELQFVWTKESATRVAQLLAGEVHIASIPRDLQDEITSQGMMIQKSTLPSFHVWIRIPYYQEISFDDRQTPRFDANEPIRNSKVREALNTAIDRGAINDTFFKGTGTPDIVEYFPPWRADCKDEWAPFPGPDGKTGCAGGWPYEFNPQKARDLLAEAGYPNGFDLEFLASGNLSGVPELPDVAEAITQWWTDIGINVNLNVIESGQVRARQNDRDWTGSVNLVRYSIDPISLSISFAWFENRRGFIEHQFVTDWKRKYDQIIDADTRFKMGQDLGDFFHNENVTMPLLWLFAEVGVNPNVVESYEVSQLHFGPVRYHEYTKAVYK